jgi:hypothetical protein
MINGGLKSWAVAMPMSQVVLTWSRVIWAHVTIVAVSGRATSLSSSSMAVLICHPLCACCAKGVHCPLLEMRGR